MTMSVLNQFNKANYFCSQSMLVFPEISEPEDVQHLNEMIAPIERFFCEACK